MNGSGSLVTSQPFCSDPLSNRNNRLGWQATGMNWKLTLITFSKAPWNWVLHEWISKRCARRTNVDQCSSKKKSSFFLARAIWCQQILKAWIEISMTCLQSHLPTRIVFKLLSVCLKLYLIISHKNIFLMKTGKVMVSVKKQLLDLSQWWFTSFSYTSTLTHQATIPQICACGQPSATPSMLSRGLLPVSWVRSASILGFYRWFFDLFLRVNGIATLQGCKVFAQPTWRNIWSQTSTKWGPLDS